MLRYFETLLYSKPLGFDPSLEMTIERHKIFNSPSFTTKVTGYFNLTSGQGKGEAISDFANRYFGGNFLGGGLVQEELMFHKAPILFCAQLYQYINGTPITLPGYDSLVIKKCSSIMGNRYV